MFDAAGRFPDCRVIVHAFILSGLF